MSNEETTFLLEQNPGAGCGRARAPMRLKPFGSEHRYPSRLTAAYEHDNHANSALANEVTTFLLDRRRKLQP
jgi:hypothetical protein